MEYSHRDTGRGGQQLPLGGHGFPSHVTASPTRSAAPPALMALFHFENQYFMALHCKKHGFLLDTWDA
jgi:hypothetical protein